jgi:hypothetical protein
MNLFENSNMFQKLARFSFQTAGYFLTIGLVMLLILAWILTEPLLRWCVHLSDLYRIRFVPKIKGRL